MSSQEISKSDTSKREEAILEFWGTNEIFQKSVQRDAPKGDYIFYDGPPFATGLPHYGHIVASVIKDVVPRFWTMQGYRVPRRWGWDCHGLPIENIVEKEIGSKHKKDIEAIGVARFNEMCRSKVMTYADEWKRIIPRIGRWADMDDPYFTMSKDFMESVWWVFKQIYDKGLVYEAYRSMHICPRCETTLSQQEVSEGYKDIKDLAVTAMFPLTDEPNTFILAWTTTPWTLPGNVALAVGNDIDYVTVESEGKKYILAKEVVEKTFGEKTYSIVSEMKGSELVGKSYTPPFDSYVNDTTLKHRENAWKVYAADFITAESGTGIAHQAPAFGAEDMELAKQIGLPLIRHLGMDGIIHAEVKELSGLSVKPIEDPQSTDVEVIKYLAGKGLLFAKEKYEHSYPHCWRCDTPLINYATTSWFVNVEKIKPQLLESAKNINWSPEHIKEGRWGNWLTGARDWSISRQRFWASVIPLWKCEACKKYRVFGSASELEEASGKHVDDLHKHIVDEITVPCDCGGTMKRIPDVLDTWFDSGSMPYGQVHYPFENKEKFEKAFPAQFIAEGLDQTRAWFYYLHVLSGAIFEKNAFQNVIVNGIVLAEDGKKMSKKLQNYPDPMEIVEKFGADALRLYLLSSPVMQADNLSFSEKGVSEWKGVLTRLENVLSFYELYKNDATHVASNTSTHILDQWILARLMQLRISITESMYQYDLASATRPLALFIEDFSTWYLRRSRERVKTDGDDKQLALSTILYVLQETAKMIAPFAPFIAEMLWLSTRTEVDPESVHLCMWSETARLTSEQMEVIAVMSATRVHVTEGLSYRTKQSIPVRQPLTSFTVKHDGSHPARLDEYLALIKEEMNVREVILGDAYMLDTVITPELNREGQIRELLRAVQDERKKTGLKPGEATTLFISGDIDFLAFVSEAKEQLQKVASISLIEEKENAGTEVTIIGKGVISLAL
ncbi:MAG: isoleucyl-tRNA synthetase, isoleucyl-tRNA synthetase [Candidatus Kaiserbacteria bacterium]|nr:isoleucyl-tRNA synthetase, isoleucyl-tRNA synthetase [Candidatus Kaiserbacteria bacterium]